MNRPTLSHPLWRWALVVSLAVLLLVLIASSRAQPAQAALYWASVNGAPLAQGIQSNTPIVCFVGNAVDVRLARVTQIINYIQGFELAGNIHFMSPAGHSLAYELGTSGNVQNLKCQLPGILPGGKYFYGGDIRIVLPGTNVDATAPVPGVGCANDELFSDPDCVSWDANHITCAMLGYDNAVWIKDWNGNWGDFYSLGGVFTSGPSIASRAANNLDVVGRGQDNGLWFNHWNGSNWSGWVSVVSTVGHIASDPDCVAVDSTWLECSALWDTGEIWQVSYDNGTWSNTANLGKPNSATPTSGPTIASWASNRLDVVVRGADSAAWHRAWNQASGWSSWGSIGGTFTSALDCTSWDANQLDCFGRGGDNQLWQKSWDGSWTGWQVVGGTINSGPSASHRVSGGIDLFAADTDGALWFRNFGSSTWYNAVNLGQNNNWGSWSSSPWVRENPEARACLYNLKLGDDSAWCPVGGEFWPCASNPELTPYVNHTLHEVGHAMGLAHEHVRNDTDPSCTASGYGDGVSAGKLTPYDRDSVMNYQFLTCGINGNYGNSGLSYYDQLGIHMMYPPNGYPAEFAGQTTIKSGATLSLSAAWKAAGANMAFVAKNFVWKVDGATLSTSANLSVGGLSVGTHTLSFEYDDFLNRHYSSSGTVRVLSAAQLTKLNAVIAAENAALTAPIHFVDLPAVNR
jgi:hypothetical protein